MKKIILFIMLLTCFSCVRKDQVVNYRSEAIINEYKQLLPIGSSEIIPRGNGWVTFHFNGYMFICLIANDGSRKTSCMAKI